jgi:hypothetical protein
LPKTAREKNPCLPNGRVAAIHYTVNITQLILDRSLTVYGAFFIACFMIVLRRVVQ